MLKILSREEFARRTSGGAKTAVFKEFLADRETPVAALSRLGNDEDLFLLESVSGAGTRARFSYLGIEPRAVAQGPCALETLKREFSSAPYSPAPELPSFQGGAAGYIAYDAIGVFEPHVKPGSEPGTPPMAFMLCDTFLVFDNVRDTVTVAAVAGADGGADAAYDAAMSKIRRVYDRLLSAESIAKAAAAGARRESTAAPAEFRAETSREEFREMVLKCKEAIAAGEAIQIVPSQKFTARTSTGALALYRALRSINPSPYNFIMRIGGKTLVGSSPEELVKLAGRTASTAPIAGTRPRGATPAEDAALERDLKSDEKENAEHVMLVDLGRNDLGRVCETGSVRVDSFARVERYSHVMHLVSGISGTLKKECDAFDLARAAFPAGTLTGAPKIRAMQLIAETEKSPRGAYGGAAGYFSFTGDMDLAIVIRTAVLENGTVSIRSGAGIVADSDPDKEYEETLNKAKAVFEAVRFAETL